MGAILTKHGEKTELATLFGVSLVTVKDALRGKTKSDLAQRIRKIAVDRGGVEEPENTNPKIIRK